MHEKILLSSPLQIKDVASILSKGMYNRLFSNQLNIIPQLNEVYELALSFYESQILTEEERKKILEINENFTIILVSPYGQQPNQAVININQWLLEAGLITLSDSRENLASVIDWERTYAYSPGCDAQIYLNRRGREPKGIVEAGREAKEVRERICATLSDKVKQANEPLISNISRAEDFFSGPYIDSAPDLILELAPGCGVYNSLLTTEQSRRSNPAGISPNIPADFGQSNCGVFVSNNHKVKIHEAKEHMQLEDITPTILSLMGIPIPQSMDGEPAYTLFEERRSLPPNKSTWEDKLTNVEVLQERVSNLEEALQLKQVELAVHQHNLTARHKEIEELKKQVVNLAKEIEGFRSGRVIRLLLWGGNFFKSLRDESKL